MTGWTNALIAYVAIALLVIPIVVPTIRSTEWRIAFKNAWVVLLVLFVGLATLLVFHIMVLR